MYKWFILFMALTIVSFSETPQNKKKPPPGTIRLNENIFIDSDFISNRDWQEFLYVNWLGLLNTNLPIPYLDLVDSCEFIYEEKYVEAIDTLLEKSIGFVKFSLQKDSFYNKKMTSREISKSVGLEVIGNELKLLDYPVLGIYPNEARDYCEWRTKAVMFSYSKTKKSKRSKYFSKIKYRLPTESELNEAKEKFKNNSSFKNTGTLYELLLNQKIKEITIEDLKGLNTSPQHNSARNGFRCVCEIVEK